MQSQSLYFPTFLQVFIRTAAFSLFAGLTFLGKAGVWRVQRAAEEGSLGKTN
jgi:hypothetical protein